MPAFAEILKLSIYRRFWVFEFGFYSVTGAHNFCACGIFLVLIGDVRLSYT